MAFSIIEIKPVALVVRGVDSSGTIQKFFFSNYGHTNTDGVVMGATPGYVQARLNSLVKRRDLFSQGRLRGPMPINIIAAELENSDGALDTMRGLSFDGQNCDLYSLNPALHFQSRTPAFPSLALLSDQPIFDESTVTFSFRDKRYDFARPMTTRKFLGTNTGGNGIEGTASDIKDQLFPLVYGQVRNIPLILVNSQKLIYAIGSGTDPSGGGGLLTGWSMSLYDMGVTLTADPAGNYTSQADMEANQPAPGMYRVWTVGYLRLGSTPAGIVTADLNNPVGGSSTITSIFSKWVKFTPTSSGVPPTVVNILTSDPVAGIYLSSSITVLDAMSELLGSVNGYMNRGFSPSTSTVDSAHIGQLVLASALPYTPTNDNKLILTESMILDPGLKNMVPAEDERGLPVWRVTVQYSKNYSPMTDDQIAGSVVDPARAALKQPFLSVSQSSISVLTQWPNATELTVTNAYISNVTDATAEALRLLNLLKVKRDMFSLQIPKSVLYLQSTDAEDFFQPGLRVFITHSRFGLSAGKMFLLLGYQESLDTITLTVWG